MSSWRGHSHHQNPDLLLFALVLSDDSKETHYRNFALSCGDVDVLQWLL